jgi:hypothetical protein
MTPPLTEVDDIVCIVLGGDTPYLVRGTQEDDEIKGKLVGECYVHGMMHGEMMKDRRDEWLVLD